TFIAGISGTAVQGADVVVNGSGKLGVVVSSARYKHQIKDMGAASGRLMELRPVTFKYKNDESGITQYGLVAEEVEKIYPELVTYDVDGRVDSVRYSMLTSMLLNETQKQSAIMHRQEIENAQLRELVNQQAEQIRHLSAQQAQILRRFTNLEHAMKSQ